MRLHELHDYDCKSASKINQKSLFIRNVMKVKTLVMVAGFLLMCTGFYLDKKSMNHKMAK